MSDIHNPAKSQEDKHKRRRFLQRLSLFTGGLFAWDLLGISVTTALGQDGTSSTAANEVLTPYYLPKGFGVAPYVPGGRFIGRRDGFGGGDSEIAWWYINADHPKGFNNPLAVYVCRNPVKEFWGTYGHVGEERILSLRGGSLINAVYHDGMWTLDQNGTRVTQSGTRLGWNTSNVHSLVFDINQYRIGIRGSRQVGVNTEELFKVASSIL
jgi:hypothetical protein